MTGLILGLTGITTLSLANEPGLEAYQVVKADSLDIISIDPPYEVECEVKLMPGDPGYVAVEEQLEMPVLPEYQDWDVATIKGKLKMQGLPLSPSVKIFMLKDSLVDISLTAPFVGEAGRMVLTPDSVKVVNKMGKKYWISPTMGIGGESLVRMAQDFLLRRFFVPGFNTQDFDINELVDVYYVDGDQYYVVPKEEAEIESVDYGYIVDRQFTPMMLVVLPEGREAEMDVFYTSTLGGYDIRVMYKDGGKGAEATLELKNPEWKGTVPKPLEINKKFSKAASLTGVF